MIFIGRLVDKVLIHGANKLDAVESSQHLPEEKSSATLLREVRGYLGPA